jgi:hypothetical protein
MLHFTVFVYITAATNRAAWNLDSENANYIRCIGDGNLTIPGPAIPSVPGLY